MFYIIDVIGREVLDSRGNPTVEVEVQLDNGVIWVRGHRQSHSAVGCVDRCARGC